MAGGSRRLRQLAGTTAGLGRALERIGFTVSGAGVVVLVVIGWFAARIIGAKTMYLLVYACILMIGLAWLVARRRLALEVDRSQVPLRLRVGQQTAVELRVRAKRRVSMILIQERLHPLLGATVSVPVATLRAGDELAHEYTFRPKLRGVYPVGPTTATWSDPLGLTAHSQRLAEPSEIIVHPEIERARDRVLTRMWEDPPIRPPVSKPWPVGFEFYGMRDYVPGDDLRRVVWTAYARTGRMLVRESEQGITDQVVILVDTDEAWHSPGEVSETFETAVKVAASVGVQHLDDGFSVALLTNDGPRTKGLRGSVADLAYLDELSRLGRGRVPLRDAGFHLLEAARYRPHFLVVTPHVGDAEAQQLKLLVDRGLSVVVASLEWEESDPLSLARAASLGATIVQVPPGAPLAAVFANQVSAR